MHDLLVLFFSQFIMVGQPSELWVNIYVWSTDTACCNAHFHQICKLGISATLHLHENDYHFVNPSFTIMKVGLEQFKIT